MTETSVAETGEWLNNFVAEIYKQPIEAGYLIKELWRATSETIDALKQAGVPHKKAVAESLRIHYPGTKINADLIWIADRMRWNEKRKTKGTGN